MIGYFLMEISGYQAFKLFLTELLGVSRDGFHILLTFFVFLLVGMLFKWRLSSPKMLIAPFLFALLLEVLDTRDAIVYGFRVDVLDSVHDIILGMLLPTFVWLYARTHEKSTQDIQEEKQN